MSQKSAWMRSDLFKDQLFNSSVTLVKKYLRDQRIEEKVVLLIDNATTQPAEELKAAKFL